MIKPVEISDNAMLFKDITQWIRNKTFLLLFFGLLFGSGIISFFVVSVSGESAQVGIVAFSIYTVVLFLYTMTIAGMGFNLTAREFANKTFELYELSGMSLERMIVGKFLSLVVQFLFGYFCIVPFMFFSYFLGGLDFASIFGASFMMVLFAIPLYLFVLLLSLSSKTVKIGTFGRIFVILVLLYMGIGSLGLFLAPHSPFRGVSDFFKALFVLDLSALKAFFIFLLFYIQFCLLLFYLCCHFISSANDSRELQIKFLLFTLILSWFFLFLVVYRKALSAAGDEMFYLVYVPVYLMMLMMGGFFYFHRFDPPIIIRNRQNQARRFRRIIYYLFQPGAEGMHRLIMYLLLIVLVSFIFLLLVEDPKGDDMTALLNNVSLCLQVPFFLAIPGGMLLCIRSFQKNIKKVKALFIVWWILSGVFLLIVYGILESSRYMRHSSFSVLIELVSLVLSPLSSILIGIEDRSPFYKLAYIVRGGLGFWGFLLMIWILRRRRKLNENVQVQPI
jgi:hypothetical protein